MCGLVGVMGSSNITVTEEKIFKSMWLMDTVRGTDSSGLLVVTPAGITKMVKDVGCPPDLYDPYDPKLKHPIFGGPALITGVAKIMAGHNRAATVGFVSRETAHPFEYDGIIGMHNGTIPSWQYSLMDDEEDDEATDTMQLIRHIARKGIDATWDAMYEDDAAAIVWWDGECLNMIRNKHRPLYVSYTSDGTLLWASEPWMIMGATWRHKVKLAKDPETKKEQLPFQITENKLYRWAVQDKKVKLVESRTIKGCERYMYGQYRGNRAGFFPNGSQTGGNSQTGDKKKSETSAAPSLLNRWRQWQVRDWGKVCAERAGVDVRGTRFHITDVSNLDIGECTPHVIGRTSDGNKRVFVYANSPKELNYLCDMKLRETWKMNARPRVVMNDWKQIEYHIMYDNVELANVVPMVQKDNNTKGVERYIRLNCRGPNGQPVSQARFEELLAATPSQSCGFCGDPITPEMGEDVVWLSEHTLLCQSCDEHGGEDVEMYKQAYHHHLLH